MGPASFNVEWYLEIKIWVLEVLIAAGVEHRSRVLSLVRGREKISVQTNTSIFCFSIQHTQNLTLAFLEGSYRGYWITHKMIP